MQHIGFKLANPGPPREGEREHPMEVDTTPENTSPTMVLPPLRIKGFETPPGQGTHPEEKTDERARGDKYGKGVVSTRHEPPQFELIGPEESLILGPRWDGGPEPIPHFQTLGASFGENVLGKVLYNFPMQIVGTPETRVVRPRPGSYAPVPEGAGNQPGVGDPPFLIAERGAPESRPPPGPALRGSGQGGGEGRGTGPPVAAPADPRHYKA